jgi:hypothetical protein
MFPEREARAGRRPTSSPLPILRSSHSLNKSLHTECCKTFSESKFSENRRLYVSHNETITTIHASCHSANIQYDVYGLR